MTRVRQQTGRIGEDLACEQLAALGFTIAFRNCRTRYGEIDVIALDQGTLVFVEVKTMRAGARSGPERPTLAVGPRKQMQVRRLARSWLAENAAPHHRALRFDVVGVLLHGDGRAARIEHIPDAF